MASDPHVSIGFVAARTGLNVSAIRFYADRKLIPFDRNSGGHRIFRRSVIRRVSFILIAQGLGYTLQEVAELLASLPNGRTPTKSDWQKLSTKFNRNIEARIEQLRKLQSSLSSCIGCGCLSLRQCQLYNRDDQISARGAGPRYLLGDAVERLEDA